MAHSLSEAPSSWCSLAHSGTYICRRVTRPASGARRVAREAGLPPPRIHRLRPRPLLLPCPALPCPTGGELTTDMAFRLRVLPSPSLSSTTRDCKEEVIEEGGGRGQGRGLWPGAGVEWSKAAATHAALHGNRAAAAAPVQASRPPTGGAPACRLPDPQAPPGGRRAPAAPLAPAAGAARRRPPAGCGWSTIASGLGSKPACWRPQPCAQSPGSPPRSCQPASRGWRQRERLPASPGAHLPPLAPGSLRAAVGGWVHVWVGGASALWPALGEAQAAGGWAVLHRPRGPS